MSIVSFRYFLSRRHPFLKKVNSRVGAVDSVQVEFRVALQ